MADYGEFQEVKEEQEQEQLGEQQPARMRMPQRGEYIGVILQRLGGNRMDVMTTDGKTRNCRVPGRYKRVLWLRPKDIVLVVPWPDDDKKGDIIFKYNSFAINQLRKRGILNTLQSGF